MSDLNRFQKRIYSKNITHTIVVKACFGILTSDNMVRKSEKVEPLSIKNIEPIFNHIFNNDDVKRISESVSETGYPPIIARHDKGSKYQLCSNPEIFEALFTLELFTCFKRLAYELLDETTKQRSLTSHQKVVYQV